MGWEFGRKTGPSENVMVPATSDPFERPKWAPPVLHMPPVIVLVYNLIGALARLVWFLARHPIEVGVAGGLGWLAYTFGWQTPALIVAVVLALLGGWAVTDLVLVGFGVWTVADRWSFVRWVARPLRARWRYVRVYRANWAPVMTLSGLAFYRNAHQYLPSIKRVVCTGTTDRVLVKMLSGQAPSIWEDHTTNLAHGFEAQVCRIRTARPGWIWLELVRTDSLTRPIPALPIGRPGPVNLKRLVIGRCEDGTPWLLRLLGTHVLVAGVTGAGKGSVIWSTVRALLPAVRAGLVEIWGLDPKRMELAFGKALFRHYSDDPNGGMVDLLERAVTEMQARADEFGGATRTFTPTARHKFKVVFIDELAFLTAYCPERDLRRRAEAAIAILTSQGRSVGICVVGLLQDPRKEVINVRNLFPTRIALRLDEDDQVDMVLGDGARDRGALADQISSDEHTGAGIGYVRLEKTPDPVRVRAAFVSDADIAAMGDYLRHEPVPIGAGRAERGAA
jgi:DNA segregation ATPase FtsK/SpoIIIE, S-DNA-T family